MSACVELGRPPVNERNARPGRLLFWAAWLLLFSTCGSEPRYRYTFPTRGGAQRSPVISRPGRDAGADVRLL
jgi:hypothetical protein